MAAVVLLSVLVAGGLAAGGRSWAGTSLEGQDLPTSMLSGSLSSSSSVTPHLIVNLAASDSVMINYVLSSVIGFLRPGDTLDLTHDPSNPISSSNLATINQVASTLQSAAPAGVILSAHSGYVPQVGILANGTTRPITAVVATLEPNGATPGLSYTFTAALSYFEETTSLDHARGLLAVAYPTSSFLLDGDLQQYHWNYGQLAATSDSLWVEMQGYAIQAVKDPSVWSTAITTLTAQMTGAGQPLSKLAIQIILGNTPGLLGVDPAEALADIKVAEAAGITSIDLWTEPGWESYLGPTVAGINRTTVPHSVTFTESGLPSGTNWSVTLDGSGEYSHGSAIGFTEPNGSYGYSVLSPTPANSGTRYVATPSTGSVDVNGANVSVSVSYGPQYALTVEASPVGAGTVSPTHGWYASGKTVSVEATPTPGNSFSNWSGEGTGSYTGPTDPVVLTVGGPITETAEFVPTSGSVVAVNFTEIGLPLGTPWNVSLDGQWETSSNGTVEFEVANGSYDYAVESPVPGANLSTQYGTTLTSGTVEVGNTSVDVTVPYLAEYTVNVSAAPVGSGVVSPSSGWFAADSEVALSAVPRVGYDFAVWNGTGVGNYTGGDPAPELTIEGPVTEVAEFVEPNVTPALLLVVTGLPPGTNWSLEVGGSNWTTNQTAITVPASQGPVEYTVESPIPVSPGVQYVALPSTGTVNLTGGPVDVTVSYVLEAELESTVTGVGTVTMTPGANGWYPFGTTVEITAVAPTGSVFAGWSGTGNGSYSGSANPLLLQVGGPIVEVAHFLPTPPVSSGGGSGGGSGSWAGLLTSVMMVGAVLGTVIGMNVAVGMYRQARRRSEPRER